MKKVIFCWCTGKGQNYRVENCRQQSHGAAGSNPGDGAVLSGVNPHRNGEKWLWRKPGFGLHPSFTCRICHHPSQRVPEGTSLSPSRQCGHQPSLGTRGMGGMGRAAPRGGWQQGGGSTCTCTRIESLHVAGTRRAFACIIIQSALVIIAWANPARAGVILGLLDC